MGKEAGFHLEQFLPPVHSMETQTFVPYVNSLRTDSQKKEVITVFLSSMPV